MKKSLLRASILLLFIFALLTSAGCDIILYPTKTPEHTVAEDVQASPQISREPYTKLHYSGNIQHFDIPFAERSRDTFDKSIFIEMFFEFKNIIDNEYDEENESRLIELYEKMKSGLMDIKTDVALAEYYYRLDVSDEENAEFYTSKKELYNSYYGKSLHLFKTVFSTKYAGIFSAHIGDWLADKFSAGGRTVSEEEKALQREINDLKLKYDEMIFQDATDTAFKQLYIEIVNANNKYARLLGYDNYAEYAYIEEFARDYTGKDLKAIEDEIIDEFLPLYIAYVNYAHDNGNIYALYDENNDSGKEKFTRLRKCIQNISPELTNSLDHLIRNGLYDVDGSNAKLDASGFTQGLYSYNDAYIFIAPNHNVTDYMTVIHEFGHYNRAYYTASDPFSPKGSDDIEEIMSQGLQLLCYDYYDDYNESYGSELAMQTIRQKMRAILDGFAVNESEYLSYTTPNLTIEKLNEIWNKTYDKYGIAFESEENSWIYISQVFRKPFYYINYATSSLASFEIFVESRVDFNSGIDKYMTITALPKGVGFVEAIKTAGLKNIFDKGSVTKLSDNLANFFELQK